MKKRLLWFLTSVPLLTGLLLVLAASPVKAAFNANNIMDDSVFDNTNSMSAGQIDTWLNQFPSSCISPANGFTAPEPIGYNPSQGFLYGGNATAGTIIYNASKVYGLNPQVILATLQKESSVVTGDASYHCQYINTALGYDCPDSGNCPQNPATESGFSKQVIHAIWALKFWQQRSKGNVSWDVQLSNFPHAGNTWDNSDDPQTCYSHRMTQGTYQICPSGPSTFYDGWYTIDSTAVHMDTGATAALYDYTPHFHGNQNFVSLFEGWFGSTVFSSSSVTMNNISQPDTTPALGQTISYTVSFTNNLSSSITLDAVGIVGRLGNVNNGANRDFGWQGPVTLTAGQTQQFTFTTTVYDLGTIYVWPALNYHGIYVHYNNWGAQLNTHIPNLGATISQTTTSPTAGQSDTLSATINNYEGQDIKLDAAGIPVRFFGSYNYDVAWLSSLTIPAGGSSPTISGTIIYDKPGPYKEWVSAKIGGSYITVSPTVNLTAAAVAPSPQSIQLSYTTTPDPTPALGEDVTISYTLKNTYGVPITLDAVGVVGRYDSPYTGANRDFGWQGPDTFAAGQTKTYSFTSNVSDIKNFYAWVAIRYQGNYVHYNNWGFMMAPHIPNLTLSTPLTVNNGSPPALNQSTPVIATIKNNESHPIKYNFIGIPARYYGVYNYDVTWSGSGTLAASGQTGDHVDLSGNIVFDKPGPYTLWASINIQGRYITVGTQKNFNL